jgi:hypothetical protein
MAHKLNEAQGLLSTKLEWMDSYLNCRVQLALRHIREVILPPEKCLILTDSLSSIKAMLSRRISWQTHPLVYECKQLCFDLMRDLIEVKLMWIPSDLRLVGHELVDGGARYDLTDTD